MSKRHTMITALVAIVIISIGHSAHAHKPLLAVEDNRDGTIYIEAGFSDGSSAAGHKILIKDKQSGKTLSEHRVGEDGTLEIKKPSVKYTVTLDAGVGHTVTQDGPPPDTAQAKADVAADEKRAAAPPPDKPETVSQAAQQKPAAPSVAPGTGPEASVMRPASFAPPAAAMSQGVLMAFKMMMITQVVTAVALIVLVVIIAYYIGYTMGRNSGAISRRKEV